MTVPAFNSVAWFEFGTDQPRRSRSSTASSSTGSTSSTPTPGQELGAEVLMEPVSDSAGFTFARLEDTAGNHFGVFSVPAQ
ncbi:VOC family protein [Streptomyces litchfieldiae]|uniref:Glyoxalase-like domain-containing protein n=1 Tax=Streptomyces litchfieldiae TaxID=3075543 RepID=A0ABU2MRC4_9ACTN|nr:hypothetical protein [Streptomyces sp. DSM 44938]MDT0344178.1 hypothetical protein [Streptomyces sp. DSM 44938]